MILSKKIYEELILAIEAGHVKVSFSQLGEDGILWWLFNDRANGFYVDVGCHHPYKFSNTAILHLCNGWNGINIDMDQRSIDAFNNIRPNDINLCIAIGAESGQMEASFFKEGAVNSLDPGAASNPQWAHSFEEKRLVDVRPLRDILKEHLPEGKQIDFLNIDAEGFDYAVLTSNDWSRYKPEVIAIEAHGFDPANPQGNATFDMLSQLGYSLISHCVVTSFYKLSK